MPAIRKIESWPVSFALPGGAGSDAVHTDPEYGYAVTRITTDGGDIGYGIDKRTPCQADSDE